MANEFGRNIKDTLKTVTKALPAAGANVNCDTIDLETAGGIKPENLEVEISIPSGISALVDGKVVTIKMQDSADDNSYADTDPLIQTTATGKTGNGYDGKTVRFRLPPNVKRYIQFNASVPADAGTITSSSITYSLCF